jgi:formylglycine-generating enzyme required for sulfatase activity
MKNISVSYQILLITVTTALFSTSCSTESPTNNEEPRSNYTNRDLTLTATLSGDTHMEFMWIDGGSFLMGSPLEEQVEVS